MVLNPKKFFNKIQSNRINQQKYLFEIDRYIERLLNDNEAKYDYNDLLKLKQKYNIENDDLFYQRLEKDTFLKYGHLVDNNLVNYVFKDTESIQEFDRLETVINILPDERKEKGMMNTLKKVRHNSRLVYAPLETIRSNFSLMNLQKNEFVYLHEDYASWNETRIQTVRHSSGGGMSFGIGYGIRLGSGSGRSYYSSKEVLKEIISGHLIITNKRIIIYSNRASKQILLNKIILMDLYKDALVIHKGTQHSVILKSNLSTVALYEFIMRIFNEYS
ncbi:hypothetical protein ACMGE6_02245 [Macrococcus equi]|uniref:hypothetical protein n=1 Tax=Macrococcus equi TaxID=3395462 RepID=UPI0039BE395E